MVVLAETLNIELELEAQERAVGPFRADLLCKDVGTDGWVLIFTEEHRSTLDWLNKITNESFRFFGLEVELWRIGSSPAAPKSSVCVPWEVWLVSLSFFRPLC